MKLLRYGPSGSEKSGLLDQNGRARDLSNYVADITGITLQPACLELLRSVDPMTLPVVEYVTCLSPCVGGVGKIICVGLNYVDHAAESNMAIPSEPVLLTSRNQQLCLSARLFHLSAECDY
ncbi:MAG TPA: hypothetical protein VNO35_00965 [Steroidobacteraceae bacterium]|nr:hypothetical protein [Steroidobacteraceae bacterium]